MMPLEREFRYFQDHQEDLIAHHRGKVVVIVGNTVMGVYDSEAQAVTEAKKTHPMGSFLVQRCEPGASTQTFHSRVVFH